MYESIFRRAVRRLILVMRLSTLQPNRRHMNAMLGGWSNRRPRVDSSYMPGWLSPYNFQSQTELANRHRFNFRYRQRDESVVTQAERDYLANINYGWQVWDLYPHHDGGLYD